MRRLYFVAPNVKTAQRVVHNLLLARVEERHIHVLAKEGVPLQDLPEASLAQKSDLAPAIERGLAYGGAAGVLAGVAAITLPPAGLVLGGGRCLGRDSAGPEHSEHGAHAFRKCTGRRADSNDGGCAQKARGGDPGPHAQEASGCARRRP